MITARYLVRRTLNSVLAFVVAVVFIFIIPRLMPGSPTDQFASQYRLPGPVVAELKEMFGLDKSIETQFVLYIKNVLLTFPPNFGLSYNFYPATVWSLLAQALPWTIFLLGTSSILTAILGVALGMMSAWYRGSKLEAFISSSSMFMLSVPYFWVAMILVLFFGVFLRLFPFAGAVSPSAVYNGFSIPWLFDVLYHGALPVLTLTIGSFASYTLIMKDNMMATLGEDYILTAEAKGVKREDIMIKHAARNAVLPVMTLFVLRLGFLVGGSILTETVFSYPGIGLLLYGAVTGLDYPLIQGAFFVLAFTVILSTLVADILYTILDPRIRY
jgi:peptide/nickel transport system permease protein